TPSRRLRGAVARPHRTHVEHPQGTHGGTSVSTTNVQKDPENLTMTVTAELDAPPERVWQLWADPRQFERWWGAPGYPATATAFELRPGGKVEYHLSGPDGDTPNNVWEILEADQPRRLVLRDAIV